MNNRNNFQVQKALTYLMLVQMAQYVPRQHVKTHPRHQPQRSRHVITQAVVTDDNLDKKNS